MATNYTTAIFLINRDVRAVLCTYEPDVPGAPNGTRQRIMFKTLDPTIKAGDYAIVPTDTRHLMTVVRVAEVDVDVDFDSEAKVDWIIGVADRTAYTQTVCQEASAIQAIKQAERWKKRDELRSALLASHEATIRALPIANLAGVEAAPAGADAPKADGE